VELKIADLIFILEYRNARYYLFGLHRIR